MQNGIILALVFTNAITLWWALRWRVPASKQVRALQRVIAAFEVEGQTILHISKINPDEVYLRSVR